jgi:hypothetical protein
VEPRLVWINETGVATVRTKRTRSGEWWRAIAAFAAEPPVEHVAF